MTLKFKNLHSELYYIQKNDKYSSVFCEYYVQMLWEYFILIM